MYFNYQAKKRSGDGVSGQLEADSLQAARQQLRAQGLFVTHIAPLEQSRSSRPAINTSPWKGRVTKTDLVMAMSQLTIMTQSGVDLAEALENIAQQATKPAIRSVWGQVLADVSGGVPFSDAMRNHPHIFDETIVASIASGEHTGNMAEVLKRLTDLLRSDMRLHSTIWSMLMYPIVLCGVTVAVLCALIFFVLPQFATVFESLDKPAPPFTQLLLNFGAYVRGNLILVLSTAGGVVALVAAFRRSPPMCRLWDHATLNVIFVRDATRALLTGRSFRMLGTMLISGVPLVDGLRLCQSAAKNNQFRKLFERVEREVLLGEGLGVTLLAAKFLPPGAAQMVATAERSGSLGEVIKQVGEYYEDVGERQLRDLIKVLEPAVIVVLGIIVAGIVLSMVLPMLDVSTGHG